MKSFRCKFPYDNFVGYKQTLKDGRCRIYLWDKETNKRKLISLARYNMSVHIGRILSKNEEVDHIDGDYTNDSIDNLQILSRIENQRKATIEHDRSKKFVELKCVVCGNDIVRELRHVKMRVKDGSLPTCNKSCSGKIPKMRREGLL